MQVSQVSTARDVDDLVDDLLDPRRYQPLVVITPAGDTNAPRVPATLIHKHLTAGGARIVQLTSMTVSHALSDHLPPGLQVYGGALRLYRAPMTLTDDRYRHPLFFTFVGDDPQVTARKVAAALTDAEPRRRPLPAPEHQDHAAPSKPAPPPITGVTPAIFASPTRRAAAETTPADAPAATPPTVSPPHDELAAAAQRLLDIAYAHQSNATELGAANEELRRRVDTLTRQLEAVTSPPPDAGADLARLADLKRENLHLATALTDSKATTQTLKAQITDLQKKNRALRNAHRQEHRSSNQRIPVVYADPEVQLRHELHLTWLAIVPEDERGGQPLRTFTIGPDFIESLGADLIDKEHTLRACVDVLTRRVYTIGHKRRPHPQRTSTAGNAPQQARGDGGLAWRATIRDQAGGPRLLWWELPNGKVELCRAAHHDDVTMS